VPKIGHVTITKIENLYIVTPSHVQKFTDFSYSFRPTTKNNEVI